MNNPVPVREIRKEDNPHLAILIREVFDEHGAPHHGTVYSDPTTDDLYALFSKSRSVLFVAEKENRICGCCGIYPTEGLDSDTAELAKFYLHPDYRGKGIGRALMEKCIEAVKSLGYKKLYIESLPQFAKAVRIYEKQGFRRISRPLGNSGHTSCDIWMVKEL
ncbi:MAG: GNAT family N-acetyltransferase [Marinilabiliales bacterium]|nr:MAG: GNAT family N-acetyltransferase [Marinilabiliales bacterium]